MMFRHRYTLRHEKISTRQSPLSGAWSEIGEDPWVMRIVHGVQNPIYEPATTGNLGSAYKLLPEVVDLEPVCLRAAEQRRYTARSTLPRQLQLSVPCNQGNREWTPIKDLSNFNAIMCSCAALWKHLGKSSGPSRRTSG